jgi:hypothetical protein
MLYQSDYWLAASASERLETLRDFLDTDEGIRTLVIIEKYAESDLVKLVEQIVSEGHLMCNVSLVLCESCQTRLYEEDSQHDEVGNVNHMKTIYACPALDNYAVDLLRTYTPILALFV